MQGKTRVGTGLAIRRLYRLMTSATFDAYRHRASTLFAKRTLRDWTLARRLLNNHLPLANLRCISTTTTTAAAADPCARHALALSVSEILTAWVPARWCTVRKWRERS